MSPYNEIVERQINRHPRGPKKTEKMVKLSEVLTLLTKEINHFFDWVECQSFGITNNDKIRAYWRGEDQDPTFEGKVAALGGSPTTTKKKAKWYDPDY